MPQAQLPVDKQPQTIEVKLPDWLPQSVRDRILEQGGFAHTTSFTKAERKVLRKRKKIPVSEWAERYRVVIQSSLPGPWRNATTPYLAGLMDAANFPSVQEIGLCKAPQVGGSEAAHNFVGYTIDRDPGPVLYVYPDEVTAKENNKDRVEPMIKNSPRLRSYMTGVADDSSSLRINLQHMLIFMAWARSASRLGNKPIKVVIFDETDKYPTVASKREAGPIPLGKKRTQTYKWSRKIWYLSTPTVEQAPIWLFLSQDAEAVFHYEVVCPLCGHRQKMELGDKETPHGIKWPEDERDSSRIESLDLAWYKCFGSRCQSDPEAVWSDYQRDRAVRAGRWVEANTGLELFDHLKKHRPQKIGFHLPAWISPFVSLSEIAAAFLRSRHDKTELKDFMNNYMAQPWTEYEVQRDEDQILELCDQRPRGLVPQEADVLLAAVDTQDNGFWFEIRAFAAGFLLESWQVREGFIAADWSKVDPEELQGRSWPYHPAFDALRRILWEDYYRDSNGNNYSVFFAGIDAMGHLTSDVYDFCRVHRGKITPLQGKPNRQNTSHRWSKMDTYSGSNKPIPGGVQLLQLDVNHYKDKLSAKLQVAAMDPGAWHLHSETSRDWAKQLCAEYLDERSHRWVCPQGRANHAWDCSVYVLALARILGVHQMASTTEQQTNRTSRSQSTNRGKQNPYTGGRNPFVD